MRIAAAWVAIIMIVAIAAYVSQLWDERERRKAQAMRDLSKERILRGFDTPVRNRSLEHDNRTKPR